MWYLIVSIPDLCTITYFCNFPIGILGRVWYLIVSTPDLCTLTYFAMETVNLKFDLQIAYKNKYPTGVLFSNRIYFDYLRTMHKSFQEKNFISFRETVRERFSSFCFRQHF